MFGGNSNWRGPIWMPVNALIIRALMYYFAYYGDNFKIECPTGSGKLMNLFEVAREIANRLTQIFLRDETGRRPVFGGAEKFQKDPHWRDNLLFYEYFHGDNGAGIGASHQTGWTGIVALVIEIVGKLDPQTLLAEGRGAAFRPGDKNGVGDGTDLRGTAQPRFSRFRIVGCCTHQHRTWNGTARPDDYGTSIGNSWKERTLLNIVKLRYADMPIFLEIAQVIAGYQLQSALTGSFTLGNFTANLIDRLTAAGTAAAGSTYTDRPTVVYQPFTGVDFFLLFSYV